jgi:hypothetical protein
MLDKSDASVADTLLSFNEKGIDIGLLVPTETALEKSIMDAHDPFRSYLERNSIHKFSQQQQGGKKFIEATYISPGGQADTKVSLYRPQTKDGDPRVWIYNLKSYAKPYNLIGCIYHNDRFYIVNCSNSSAVDFALSAHSPLSSLINNSSTADYLSPEIELHDKLKKISAKGYLPTITKGDTGIGMTLEAELGIEANSIAEPDYKGIELKASRRRNRGTKNRVTLFSKAPNWEISPVGKAIHLLNRRGYLDKDGRLSLYHTLNGKSANSLGLRLLIDYKNDTLKQVHVNGEQFTHDASWPLEDLRKSLRTKHPATFWVKANTKIINGKEHFHYTEAIYTQAPRIHFLEMLIEDGVVTLDYAMHKRDTGNTVRDHGYLFKILPKNFSALFPKPIYYDLSH